MRTAFESEGDIRSVELLGAFATVWRERASGALDFVGPQSSARFEIRDGEVVGVESSDERMDTAEILVRAGKLEVAAFAGLEAPAGMDRARAALDAGVLSERDWRWGRKIRAIEVLADLVGWLEGSYSFDASARPVPGDFRVGIQRLLLELFLRSRDRELVHHSLGATDAPLQRSANFDEEFAGLGLAPDALAVVAAIDGRATAAEISRKTPPDSFSVEKLLAALATLGLVHPEYAAERSRESPARAAPAPAEPASFEQPAVPPSPERSDAGRGETRPPADVLAEMLLEPSEPEPISIAWESPSTEPMDQALDVGPAPETSVTDRRRFSSPWLVAILAAAVGAVLLWRARTRVAEPPPEPTTLVAATIPAAATPTLPRAEPPGAGALAAGAPATPSAEPSPVPTRVSRVPTAAPRPEPTPAGAARPPEDSRSAWLARARRDRRLAQADRAMLYTIQLELVCEIPSVEEAWRYDRPSGAMWLVAAEHRGRTCFRVLWGRYRTLDAARAAKSGVPRFFFTPTNRPVVVSARTALLP